MGSSKDYEIAASIWAEEHGVVEYRVVGYKMIYNQSYLAYLNNPRFTMQRVVDLRTGKTVESRRLKRYDPKGRYNV